MRTHRRGGLVTKGESEDEQRQEPGGKEVNWEQGCPGNNRVTGGGGGWDYGVGIGSNNMDSIEDCEYNTPLA